MPSLLDNFLRAPANTRSREVIVAHQLTAELKLAAASAGIDLRVYRPDVDRDGFDLIVEAEGVLRKVQTKVVLQGAMTRSWSIHKRLIKPRFPDVEDYGYDPSPAGEGIGGALLVITLSLPPGPPLASFTYGYFDYLILAARELQLLPSKKVPPASTREFLRHLEAKPYAGRISVPRSMLVTPRSSGAVLGLLGMPTPSGSTWPFNFAVANGLKRRLHYMTQRHGSDPRAAASHAKAAAEELGSLVTEHVAPWQ